SLPQLNAADAQEMNEILSEFRQHQLYGQLMSLMDCYDGYCIKRYETHATESASYQSKISSIQQSLDQSVASMAEFEEKLTQCEAEYASVMRKLPVPKMGRSCRKALEEANPMFRSMLVF